MSISNDATKIYSGDKIGEADKNRGMKSFSVEPLRDINQLPYNIYACYNDNLEKAYVEMLMACNTAPYTGAIMMCHPGLTPSSITEAKPDNIKRTPTDKGTISEYSSKTNTHIDTAPPPEWREESCADPTQKGSTGFSICNLSKGRGTWIIANPENIEWEYSGRDIPDYRFRQSHIHFIETPPYAMMMLAQYSGRKAVVHSSAVSLSTEDQKRLIDTQNISYTPPPSGLLEHIKYATDSNKKHAIMSYKLSEIHADFANSLENNQRHQEIKRENPELLSSPDHLEF